METLKSSETLIEGLVSSKQDETGKLFGGKFDLGKVKCGESLFAPGPDPCKVKGVDRVDSGSHGDASIKGISLFVELKGGVANKREEGSVCDVKNRLLYENQVRVGVGQQESGVNVGDLVWAIIKKQKWWPGIICDGANAPKEAAKEPAREDDILVRCFGNGNFIWCSPYEVRPFVGFFDRIPNQSTAKKFHFAFEKAVMELGHRVKADFTCSCVCSSKMKMEKRDNLGDYSVSRFEPAMFLDYIKDLGKDVSKAHKIDCAVKQNCLSAFYRSLGHLQIPMHQLKPANGTPLKIQTEPGNGYFDDDVENLNETRERRKSSFLSYPGEFGIDESNVDVNEGVDFNASGQSQPVKKPRKKYTRKNKGVEIKLCTSEVLSQLQTAAKDCLVPCESTNFDSVARFISGFRKGAFKDCSSEVLVDVPNHQILQETLSKKVRKKDTFVISPALGNNFSSEIPVDTLNHQILQETLPKKVKKKKDKSVISPALGNDLNHGSQVLNFQNVGPFNYGVQPMENIRTQWPANPDTIFNFGHLPLTHPPLCKLEPIRRKKVADNVASMPTWNADISTLPNVTHMQGLYPAPMFYTNQFGPTPPYFTGNLGAPQTTGPVPTSSTRVLKKRGRKRKNVDLQANPGPTIPLQANPGSAMPTMHLQANLGSTMPTMHLQANPGSTMDLQANPGSTIDLQANSGLIIIPNLNENVTGQKKQKKEKKSKEIGVQCIDLSYNKVQQDDLELKGTAFLLKFSSDYPLPSNQDLNSVFSKFGALIESETQVSNENLSGQVVFLDSSSAGGAFWGLQNDKPFGPVLVNYKIQHLAGSESMVPFKTPLKSPSGPKPMDSDSKSIIGPSMIPDLNTNSTEIQIIKRSQTIEEIRLPSNDNYLSYTKVHQGNQEVTGTALLLKFSPNYPLPSSQDLNLIFCKYGELNEVETRVWAQHFTGQVVFVNPSTAGNAIHRLEKEQPFGLALLSYRVDHLYNVQSAVRVNNSPVNATSLELKPSQDLGVIKKNLEMMNLMLEKSGESLSPEMRGKLESEIKGLMNKLNAMEGSSSSSCL